MLIRTCRHCGEEVGSYAFCPALDNGDPCEERSGVAGSLVRRMVGEYEGPLMEVVRQEDGVTRDIGFDTQGNIDKDELDRFTASRRPAGWRQKVVAFVARILKVRILFSGGGATVTKVYDQSGAQNHIVAVPDPGPSNVVQLRPPWPDDGDDFSA